MGTFDDLASRCDSPLSCAFSAIEGPQAKNHEDLAENRLNKYPFTGYERLVLPEGTYLQDGGHCRSSRNFA